ncbi:MAG: hypothetical protein LBS04_05830 [Tannerellaceae bacterium]|jgi:dTDP-4-amino-4,6-dideoxygalactose transaminase|nr:hypothetical protein [Tannerellaceae bacterium]
MKRIQITRSSMPGFEEYMEEIRGLWESRWLSNGGAKHLDFETALQTYLQTPHLSLVAFEQYITIQSLLQIIK